MKLKYHEDNEDHGFVVLESMPQVRTIFTTKNSGAARVPFPYIIYVVRYNKTKEGVFYSGGIYKNGLNVYGKLTPLESLDDEILYLPTDSYNKGLVCTPHEYDEKNFSSVEELVDFNINIWWQLIHKIEYDPFDGSNLKFIWKNKNLENLHEGKWKKETLRTSVSLPKGNQHFQIYLREDGSIINENWRTSLKINPYIPPEYDGYEKGDCNCFECINDRMRVYQANKIKKLKNDK